MLISFTVGNFLSFADEQTLSLHAGRFRNERIGSVLEPEVPNVPSPLRSLAIMGANGSGKSSLFAAINLLQYLVDNSAQGMQKGQKFPVESHRLNENFRDRPSRFEIEFVFDKTFYQYSLSITEKYVTHECLMERRKGQSLSEAFSRKRQDDGSYVWNLGTLPDDNARLWQESTRDNGLFLSTAVQLNSQELSKPYEWLSEHLRIFSGTASLYTGLTSHMIKDHIDDGCRSMIMNLIREADLGIRNVLVHERQIDEEEIPDDIPEDTRRRMLTELRASSGWEAEFVHRTRQGSEVSFDLEDESDGTQRIYAMAGHLVYALMHDATILFDEIDTSLHPFVVRLLIEMFQHPKLKDSRAQLIFSTHDDGLLDSGLLDRDQFVFVEKRRGASHLVSLIEYRPRKGEALRSNYLRGRYGGVPAISRVKNIERIS